MNLGIVLPIYVFFLLALILSGMPIAFGLGALAIGSLLIGFGTNMMPAAGYLAWNSLASFTLSAVPLYIFMGFLMSETGYAKYLYNKMSPFIERFVPGGLLQANVFVAAIFSFASGSSVAECAAIGAVALPETDERGYQKGLAAGSVAAGGTLGNLIPPGITLIIYGAMTETSVGKLFIGGIVPGLILTTAYMTYIGVRVKLQPHLVPPREKVAATPLKFKDLLLTLPFLVLCFAVLGSIYLGVATPSEAAALGVVVMLIIAASHRMLSWANAKASVVQGAKTSSMVLSITLAAFLMSIFLSNANIPAQIAAWVTSSGLPPMAVFSMVFVLYLILGCLMEGISILVMTTPVIYPVMMSAGFDPVWFGVLVTMMVELGLITPPVGMNLFVLQAMRPDLKYKELIYGCLPFIAVLIAIIFLMAVFPELVTFLPRMMLGK